MLSKNPNKKKKKEVDRRKRLLIPFNTGTRTHKSNKDYNRQKIKRDIQKGVDQYDKLESSSILQ